MKKTLNIIIVLSLALLSGCRGPQVVSRAPIRYVDSIVANTHIREHLALSATSGAVVNGDIAIFDTPERCLLLSEAFMEADFYDNLDGKRVSDGLPDFAGERIASLMDDRYAPYSQYIGGSEDRLRELAVRGFVAAADTICSMAAFDKESRSQKPMAKAVVLSSPYMAAYGRFDVDTLARSFSSGIQIFSPVTSMISDVLENCQAPVNVAVLASADVAGSGAYQSVFAEMIQGRGDTLSRCQVFSVPEADSSSLDVFRSVLDSCKAAGLNHVNALLVDDYSCLVSELEALRDGLMGSDAEADVVRRQVLAKGFYIVDPRISVVSDCYRTFRKRNIFTHNIAYPVASAYITSPESQSLKLMDFDESLLPDSLHDFMLDMAPKTHKSYVQNQHFAGGN